MALNTKKNFLPRSYNLEEKVFVQDQELSAMIMSLGISKIVDRCAVADYDVYEKNTSKWRNIAQGSIPAELILYSNNSKITDIVELAQTLDSWHNDLVPNGRIYCALNKWTLWCSQPDAALSQLNYDQVIDIYLAKNLKNFTVESYNYIANDCGRIGNWVHGNNRVWLKKIHA